MKNKKRKNQEYGRKPAPLMYSFFSRLIRLLAKLYLRASWDIPKEIYELQGPVIIISNHPSYLDPFLVGAALYPLKINFLAADSYFRNTFLRWLLRKIGAIPKIQFRADPTAMKAMLKVIKRGDFLGIFPEGTRTIHGGQMPIEATFARFIKKTKTKLVAVLVHGAYLTNPRWSGFSLRRGKIRVEAKLILDEERIEAMDLDQVNDTILEALSYNDYDFQKDHMLIYKSKRPALGLENILHQCPKCLKSTVMATYKNSLYCNSCGNKAIMDKYGFLHPYNEESVVFEDPVKWNDWQFEQLKPLALSENFVLSDQVTIHKSVKEGPFEVLGRGLLELTSVDFTFSFFDHGPAEEAKGRYYRKKSNDNSKDIENLEELEALESPESSEAKEKPETPVLHFPISGIWGISSEYGTYFDLVGEENTYRFYLDDGQKTILFSQALDILRKI